MYMRMYMYMYVTCIEKGTTVQCTCVHMCMYICYSVILGYGCLSILSVLLS